MSRDYRNWKNATTVLRKNEASNCHKEPVERYLLPQHCSDIAEMLEQGLRKEKETNRRMLMTFQRSAKYLAHQGLELRGHLSEEGNFIQLLRLQGETDDQLRAWLQKKQEKFICGDI